MFYTHYDSGLKLTNLIPVILMTLESVFLNTANKIQSIIRFLNTFHPIWCLESIIFAAHFVRIFCKKRWLEIPQLKNLSITSSLWFWKLFSQKLFWYSGNSRLFASNILVFDKYISVLRSIFRANIMKILLNFY